MKIFKLGLILTSVLLFVVACNSDSKETTKKTKTTPTAEKTATPTPDKLAIGEKYYKEQCVKCHKDDGTGGEVTIEGKVLEAENLKSDEMIKMSDGKYVKHITDGIPDEGMPSFKDILTEQEINDVVKYIRSDIQKQDS